MLHPYRAYWVPMTVVLVLKPEFAVTFSRGVLRIAGTLIGLLLATALFHFLPIHTATEIALIGLFTFLVRWVGPANYGIFGVTISALVVALISLTGIAPQEVIHARAVNTVLGGVLALAAYAAWKKVYEELADGFGAGIRTKPDWSPVEKDMLGVIGLEKLLAIERATVENGKQ